MYNNPSWNEGEKMGIEKTKNDATHYLIVFLIIFLLIFLPILIGLVSSNIEYTNQSKHEEKLIEEGKVKTHSDVINEIVDILKKRDEEKLKAILIIGTIIILKVNMFISFGRI